MEFNDGFPQRVQYRRTVARQMVIPSSSWPSPSVCLTPQPTVTFHALQEWVHRSGTDVVTMSPEFRQHPLADDWMLGGMVKDMHFPKAEQYFAGQKLRVWRCHTRPL
jgi:hypothetical protein